MPHDLGPLVEKLSPLIILVAAGAFVGMALQRFLWRLRARFSRRNKTYDDFAARWPREVYRDSKLLDATDQLRLVMVSDFTARPLLNQSEARVFEELYQILVTCNPSWRVMAQVSLGEILRSKDPEAFSCINAKRVDMLLVDGHCRPRHAIEYQGGAHHQGTAAARDTVKREALRRAGIGYHEVVAGQTTPSELRRLVENLVTKAEAPRSPPLIGVSNPSHPSGARLTRE